MIYCGSGFDFGKVPVLVPDPDVTYLAQFFSKKIVRNLAFSMLEAALFPIKLASHFSFFFTFVFHFMWDPEGNTFRFRFRYDKAVPVPQHLNTGYRYERFSFALIANNYESFFKTTIQFQVRIRIRNFLTGRFRIQMRERGFGHLVQYGS
jgi:hypothetical protein